MTGTDKRPEATDKPQAVTTLMTAMGKKRGPTAKAETPQLNTTGTAQKWEVTKPIQTELPPHTINTAAKQEVLNRILPAE